MSARRGHAFMASGLLVAAALSSAGCRSRRAPTELEVPAPRAVSTPQLPVDRALPGELAEGTEKAFGLILPRVMIVAGRYPDVIFASAQVPAEQVASYVRQRITADKIGNYSDRTTFTRAVVRGQPGVELAIEVLWDGATTELRIRNLSLVKPKPGLGSEEERWRAAGFKPDGTPADPTHLE